MKVRVKFYAAFKEFFNAEERELELDGRARVGDLLAGLCDSEECRKKLFDESGNLRRDVKLLRKGDNVRFLDDVQTELIDGDVIVMFPAMLGG
jgi:MoaD family protein